MNSFYKMAFSNFLCVETVFDFLQNQPVVTDRQIVVFIKNGAATAAIDGNTYYLNSNSLLIVRPNAEFVFQERSIDFEAVCMMYSMTIFHEATRRIEPVFISYLFSQSHWRLPSSLSSLLAHYTSLALYLSAQHKHKLHNEMVVSLVRLFFMEMYRQVDTTHPVITKSETMRAQQLFRKFMEILIKNYTLEHSVQFYANELCISSKYLTQITRRVLNKTPKEVIDSRLFYESVTLLNATELTIQEISNRLGFPNQSYFGRFFKKNSGVSPLVHRQNPQNLKIGRK